MIQIAFYLAYIYWRKFFVKGDFLALWLLIGSVLFFILSISHTYEDFSFLLFFPLQATLSHHFSRKDFSLLKLHTSRKGVVIIEYFIENSPFLLTFLIKNDWLYASLYSLAIIAIAFLPQKLNKTRYPFALFCPFWHTSFRKGKLFIVVLLSAFVIIISSCYKNENLGLFGLLVCSFVCTIPYFEREYLAHISASAYTSNDFLQRQIKVGILNSAIILIPVFMLFLICFDFEYYWAFPLFFILPLLGIFTKYSFFESPLMQNFVFAAVLATATYGSPILMLPILYHKSIKFIKKIQYVER